MSGNKSKMKKLEEMLQLASKYKASKIELGDIKIELSESAFKEELTIDELKEIYNSQDNEDPEDVLYHSAV